MEPTEKEQKEDLLAQLDGGLKERGFVKKAGVYVMTTAIAKVLIRIYHQRFSSSVRLDCGLYYVGLEGASAGRTPKQEDWHLKTYVDELLGFPSRLSPDLSSELIDEYLNMVESEALPKLLKWCDPAHLATGPSRKQAFGCTQNLWVNVSEEAWKALCLELKTVRPKPVARARRQRP